MFYVWHNHQSLLKWFQLGSCMFFNDSYPPSWNHVRFNVSDFYVISHAKRTRKNGMEHTKWVFAKSLQNPNGKKQSCIAFAFLV